MLRKACSTASVPALVLTGALLAPAGAHAGVMDSISAGLGKVTDAVSSIYHAGASKISDLLAGRQQDRLPQTMQLLQQSQATVADKQQQLISYAATNPAAGTGGGAGEATQAYVKERQNDLLTAQQQNSSLYQEFRQTVSGMLNKGQDVSSLAGQINAIESAQRQIETNYQTLSQTYGRFWEQPPAGAALGSAGAASAGTASQGGDNQDVSSDSSAPAGSGADSGAGGTADGAAGPSSTAGSGTTTGSAAGTALTTGSTAASRAPATPAATSVPWSDPKGQAAIDEWLGRVRLDPWGRLLNGTTLKAAGTADAGSRSRYKYVWDALADDSAGSNITLRSFVAARLRGESPTVVPAPAPGPGAIGSTASGSSAPAPGTGVPPAAGQTPDGAASSSGVGLGDAQQNYQQAVNDLQAIIASPTATADQKAAALQKLRGAQASRDSAASASH